MPDGLDEELIGVAVEHHLALGREDGTGLADTLNIKPVDLDVVRPAAVEVDARVLGGAEGGVGVLATLHLEVQVTDQPAATDGLSCEAAGLGLELIAHVENQDVVLGDDLGLRAGGVGVSALEREALGGSLGGEVSGPGVDLLGGGVYGE